MYTYVKHAIQYVHTHFAYNMLCIHTSVYTCVKYIPKVKCTTLCVSGYKDALHQLLITCTVNINRIVANV